MKDRNILLSFFIFVLVSSLIFTQKVDATSYYNWIQNPSFETYTNYAYDGGFESGIVFSNGTYGNWTRDDVGITISSSEHNTGVYCLRLGAHYASVYSTSYYTFNDGYNILGADVVSASAYFKSDDTTSVKIYYTDATSNSFVVGSSADWELNDFTDEINDSKYIDKFHFHDDDGDVIASYMDDFSIMVNDGEGQDEIVFGGNNYWQLGQESLSIAPAFGNINTVFGRIDNTSCQLDSPSETYKIIQYLDYLDTNTIHFINVYVYNANVSYNEGIKIKLLYNDGSFDEKTVFVTGDGSSWEELNFGKSWIDSDKYITLIYISPVFDGETCHINIDDVGLWSALPYGYSKFQFTISPQPIRKGSYDFDAYSNTQYAFIGYFYNVTDSSLSINGTYQISDSFGLHTGNMVNGLFSLQLDKRTYTISPYTLETLSVTVITDEEIFNIDIICYWYPVEGGVIPDTGNINSDFISNWFIYAIFLLVIPIAITSYVGGISDRVSPMMLLITFMTSETLMCAISLSIGLIDIWFMLVMIILDVLIILGLLRSNTNQ